MKRIVWFSIMMVCCLSFPSVAQKLSLTKGDISFKSNAELELIQASCTSIQGVIDPATNQFAFSIDVRAFKGFNSELQREHFNEKYMETELYPKARFSGKIIEQVDFSTDGTAEVRAKGDLEIHGVKQARIIKAKLTIHSGTVTLETHFVVPLTDHNISIPKIVSQKIATEIEVDFKATLSPK